MKLFNRNCVNERRFYARIEVSMEKVYKTMNSAGISSLVVGICVIVIGGITGAFMITTGARLLSRKKEILF